MPTAAIGVLIDTTNGNLFPPAAGFASTGSIDLGGNGTNKRGIVIQGGNTFYGPITLTTLTAVAVTGATAATQQSSLIVQGDGSAAFLLTQGTKVTSNILFGGGGILQNASVNSTASNCIMVDLDGTVNGNVILALRLSGVGAGMIGIQELGGIHSCASDTAAPSGLYLPDQPRAAADQCRHHFAHRHQLPQHPRQQSRSGQRHDHRRQHRRRLPQLRPRHLQQCHRRRASVPPA